MSHFPHDAIVIRPGQDLTALFAVLPSNSRVYLSDGTHTLSGTLVISGKTGISIEGGPNAVLAINAPAGQTMIQLVNCSDVTLQGFRISATAAVRIVEANAVSRIRLLDLNVSHANALGVGRFFTVAGTGAVTDVTIRTCVFSGVFDSVFECLPSGAASVARLKMVGNQLSSSVTTILCVQGGATASFADSILSDNTVSSIGQILAVNAAGLSNVIVRNNIVSTGSLLTSTTTVSRLIVEGNIVHAVGSHCISLVGGTDIVIRNNVSMGGTSWALALAALDRFVVSGNHLFGAGTGGVDAVRVFDCANGSVTANVIANATRYGIQFAGTAGNSNIVIDGNTFRTSGSSDLHLGGTTCIRLVISNNQFYRNVAGDAIAALASAVLSDSVVRGNTFDLPAANGIAINSGTRINVQNNILRAPVSSGISLVSCTFVTLNNNNVDSAGMNGLRVDASADLVVDGNRFMTSGATAAIAILGVVTRCVINGNRVVTSGGNGVNATGTFIYSVIRSNKILGCAVGVHLAGGCDHNVVGGNEIQSPTSIGIEFYGQFVAVTGNKVAGAGSHGIRIGGSNALVGGNTVTESAGDGIRVEAVLNVNINGNYSSNNGSDGIEMVNCDESLVQGNRCNGNAGVGIRQDVASDQGLVSSNHVRGNTEGALSLLGTNLLSINNKT